MKRKKYQANRIFTLNNPFAPRICPDLAKEIGLNESILLLQMEFWLATEGEEHEGRVWARKTVREIRETFPFLSIGTVHRVMDDLLSNEYITVGQFDGKAGRSSGWYCLNLEKLKTLKSVRITEPDGPADVPNLNNPDVQDLNNGCSENGGRCDQNGTSVLIEERIKNKHTAQPLPRLPESDCDLDSKAPKFKIEHFKDPSGFLYDIKTELKAEYPSLGFDGKQDYYKEWFLSRVSTDGIPKLRPGSKATIRQYHADLLSFLNKCVQNQIQRNGSGNGHRPVDDYRGPGRNTESDAARKKRENCTECNGTNNKLIPVIDERSGREVKVSAVCKHENSTG